MNGAVSQRRTSHAIAGANVHSGSNIPDIPNRLLICGDDERVANGRMSDGSHWARSVDGRDFDSAHQLDMRVSLVLLVSLSLLRCS